MATGKYVDNLDLNSLTELLNRIAPQCPTCGYSMTDICVERCCSASITYCRHCHEDQHFLHRTNDMRLFFIDEEILSTRDHRRKRLEQIIEQSQRTKAKAEEMVATQLRLVELCNRLVGETEEALKKIDDEGWHDKMREGLRMLARSPMGVG